MGYLESFRLALSWACSEVGKAAQKKIAEQAGMTSSYLSRIINNINDGTEQKRRDIVNAINSLLANSVLYNRHLTYEDFLSLGRHLADGGTYLTWKTLNPPAGTKPVNATVSVGWKPEPPLDHNVDLDDALPVSTKLVPLISWVTAGAFCGVIDNFQPGDAEEWIGCDVHVGENAFALEIVGDSMETEFRNGDRIIIDPSRQWENGSFVVVKIGEGEGQEATFKRIIKDGDKVYLKAENPIYPMRDMTGVPFTVCGVVVEKRKCYV